MWAVGVVLYCLLCAFPPWTAAANEGLEAQISAANYQFYSPWWDAVSDDAKALVRGLLEVDPHRRLSASHVEDHIWVRSCGGALNDDEVPDA